MDIAQAGDQNEFKQYYNFLDKSYKFVFLVPGPETNRRQSNQIKT